MRKQIFAFLTAGSVMLLAMVPAAFAAPSTTTSAAPTPITSVAPSIAPRIDNDRPTGYYIWHNEDGFHLRTHGPGADHSFVAYLRTGGTFYNVNPVKLEADDRVDVLDGGHTLAIRFHTYDFTDGVDFRVRDGERLRFNLELDGQQISTDSIFLGEDGRHPERNPFWIRL